MNTIVRIALPWPDRALHPNAAQARDGKGWLLPNPDSGLDDAAEVRRLFIYDRETGVFVRRITIGQRAKEGSIAGYRDKGRNWIRFRGKKIPVPRLAWLYEFGTWPAAQIDHINGIKDDDRISNLRDVDPSTNMENFRKARRDNRCGVLGVRKNHDKFEARIWVKGNPISLGSFLSIEDASAAYVKAKREMHAGCTL